MRVKTPLRSLIRILIHRAPLEAQLVVTRRCNLSCGYCSEHDHISELIPLEVLKQRVDALHRLQVTNISLLGGEPLLHPQIAELVAHANSHAQVSITTNGFLLSDGLIQRLNHAGLSNMQVSIDAIHPGASDRIQKTLSSLERKLVRLQYHAEFDVHVNIVLCESTKNQFTALVRELTELGSLVSVGLVHDEKGMVSVGGPDCLELWEFFHQEGTPFSFIEYDYGKRLLQGEQPDWKCSSGARYLYIDEFGNTQFCSAQRGRPDKPILQYSRDDIRMHSRTHKGCEAGCSLLCVYRASRLDNAPLELLKALFQMLRRGVLFRTRRPHFQPKGATRPSDRLVAS